MTVCVECERKVRPDRQFYTRIGHCGVKCHECAGDEHSGVTAPLAEPEGEEEVSA